MANKTVVNTSAHPVMLSGGRSLAPGEQAEDINVEEAHEAGLVESNALRVVEQAKRKRTKSAEPETEADTSDEEIN